MLIAETIFGKRSQTQDFVTSMLHRHSDGRLDPENAKRKVMTIICAFLNTDGGRLYIGPVQGGSGDWLELPWEQIGIKEDMRNLFGTEVPMEKYTDWVYDEIANYFRNYQDVGSCIKIAKQSEYIVKIEVWPYCYPRIVCMDDGSACLRVGTTNQIMTPEELLAAKRKMLQGKQKQLIEEAAEDEQRRIFISYKRADKDKVFAIKERIEQETGISCWIDLEGIESDAPFRYSIIQAIDNCKVMLFMYSASHKKITDWVHDWTVRELGYAEHMKKRIVFINLDNTELFGVFAFEYGHKQRVDANSDEALTRLCKDLCQWLGVSHNVNSPKIRQTRFPQVTK